MYISISLYLEVEALQATSGVRIQDEIELLVSNIELTTRAMNRLSGIHYFATLSPTNFSKLTSPKALLSFVFLGVKPVTNIINSFCFVLCVENPSASQYLALVIILYLFRII